MNGSESNPWCWQSGLILEDGTTFPVYANLSRLLEYRINDPPFDVKPEELNLNGTQLRGVSPDSDLLWQMETCSCDFDYCNYNQRIPTYVPDLFAIVLSVSLALIVSAIVGFAVYIYAKYKKLKESEEQDGKTAEDTDGSEISRNN